MAAGDLQNLQRQLNQVQSIGNASPPDMTRVPARILNQVSIELLDTTKTDKQISGRADIDCKKYTGIAGLRQLQKDQSKQTYYEPGCGWIYKRSNGLVPEISRGSAGTFQGPNEPLPPGAKWFFGRQGLREVEKDATGRACSSVQKCSQMRLLGQFANVCGYCASRQSVIPAEGGRARFRSDCVGPVIMGTNVGACPREGFANMNGSGAGVLESGTSVREAFTTLADLEQCTSPLTRDCVVQAARASGCSDAGTLISALQGPTGKTYGSKLEETPVFSAYQQMANPNLTPAIFADGSTSLENALADFGRLMRDTQSPNPRLASAAKELCLGAQMESFQNNIRVEPFESYDFCRDIKPTDRITPQTLVCAQNMFIDPKGTNGTDKGTAYPREARGTFGEFYETMNLITRLIASKNKDENARGIQMLRGDNSFSTDLGVPCDARTRGSETLWIVYPDMRENRQPPIVLRMDTMLTESDARFNGAPYPVILDRNSMINYNVPADFISFISLFEVRPESDTTLQLQVNTDDGFIVGHNTIPLSGSTANTWGSWSFQGNTRYTSRDYQILGLKGQETQRNIFQMKWFQGGGGATFDAQMNLGKRGMRRPNEAREIREQLYLTQEPLAPWLRLELCSRDNTGRGAQLGLFDKRFAGSTALTWGTGQQIYSMGAVSKDVGFLTTLGEKPYRASTGVADFKTGSAWHTNAYYNFTAFRTITLLVKPMANLTRNSVASVFHLVNFKNNFGTGLHLVTDAQNNYFFQHWFGSRSERVPVTMNEWNMVVFQFQGTSTQLNNVACSSVSYSTLQSPSGLKAFFRELQTKQGVGGAPVYMSAVQNPDHSGYLVLGGSGGAGFTDYKDARGLNSWKDISFTGQVAWIHGFNNVLDTEELLQKEVSQTWLNRWPIA